MQLTGQDSLTRLIGKCENMKQYDVVRIIKDDPNNELTKGQVGTILEVYEDNNYEVEISDKDG
ncbi:DUF4926 domain-containing protein [Peribacillus simplex]|uniref:DUF4926 domain-containing protein n=1 Tax=Peribacillus simplex TaxID=1478 RepID=UPI0019206C22|nr:DUF4926 domain-containing protein [Peribacillus simplex]MBD8591476.1 DUF4926 domain-containing protein [Peribacillus simplex]